MKWRCPKCGHAIGDHRYTRGELTCPAATTPADDEQGARA